MKKYLFAIFLILNSYLTAAAIDFNYSCSHERCLEGTDIDFYVSIYNNLNKTVGIGWINLTDPNFNVAVTTFLGKGVWINPNETIVINWTDKVIAPPNGYTFQIIPCFRAVIIEEGKLKGAGDVCQKIEKPLSVLPLSKIECKNNNECDKNEYCDEKFFKCKDLNCNNYSFSLEHGCINNFWIIGSAALIIIIAILTYFLIKKKIN